MKERCELVKQLRKESRPKSVQRQNCTQKKTKAIGGGKKDRRRKKEKKKD